MTLEITQLLLKTAISFVLLTIAFAVFIVGFEASTSGPTKLEQLVMLILIGTAVSIWIF